MANKKNTTSVDIKENEIVIEDQEPKKATKKPIIPKDVDPNQIVLVTNGFQGRLVYVSPRTRERYTWDEYGDTQEMEVRELRNVKSSAKKFFENNWFVFDDENDWVISYLGLNKFYKNAIKLDEFEDLLSKSPSEVSAIIEKLSAGQKKSLSYKVRSMVAEGKVDSLKMIDALEKALGIELIEK